MVKYNAQNERVKRNYLSFQREACHKSDGTITGISNALNRFETYTKHKNLSTFNKEQAIGFKNHLAKQKSQRTNQPMSKSTILSTLNILKDFFGWLAYQDGYKSKIRLDHIEYFNLSDKDMSVAKTVKHKDFPTLEQIRKAILCAAVETPIDRRNQALMAFAICTGMRDNALSSLRIKHVDINKDPILVKQEPDLVRTKFSKQIITYFFPVGGEITKIAIDWINELREVMLYGNNEPVFPRTALEHDNNRSFVAKGLEAVCWASGAPIRVIFKQLFEGAGLPYFNPHLFRNTLVHLGQEMCRSPEEFKAWSQNLGHENVLTTFTSYGNIDPYRQGDIIGSLNSRKTEENITLRTLLDAIKANGN